MFDRMRVLYVTDALRCHHKIEEIKTGIMNQI